MSWGSYHAEASEYDIKSNIINLKQGAYRNVSTLPFKIK